MRRYEVEHHRLRESLDCEVPIVPQYNTSTSAVRVQGVSVKG